MAVAHSDQTCTPVSYGAHEEHCGNVVSEHSVHRPLRNPPCSSLVERHRRFVVFARQFKVRRRHV